MWYASVKSNFEFKILISANASLNWDIFVFNFENPLVGLLLFNVNYARCFELLSPGCAVLSVHFESF